MEVPAILPPPFSTQDPVLLCRLTDTIEGTLGLDDTDRLVLIGTLRHLPLTSTSPIAAIDKLSPNQLKLLAKILIVGLLDVKGWGGGRGGISSYDGSGSTTPTSPTERSTTATANKTESQKPDDAMGRLFETLQIPPFPTLRVITTGRDIAKSLHNRLETYEANCLARQEYVCPITTRSLTLETAPLIPHSITCAITSDTVFWLLAAVVLGPQFCDHLYTIVKGAKSYSTTNGLALDSSLHKMFTDGTALLLPKFPHDAGFDPTTCKSYDVTFHWRTNTSDLGLWMTHLPKQPEDQMLVSANGWISREQGAPPNRQRRHISTVDE